MVAEATRPTDAPDVQADGVDEHLPPSNIAAEQAVLGALLLAGSDEELGAQIAASVAGVLQPEDFYREAHRTIYRALCAVRARGEAVDLLTVLTELEIRGEDDAVGGPAYLTGLLNQVPTAVHAEDYARVVAAAARRRQLILAGSRIAALGYDESAPDEGLAKAQALLLELAQRTPSAPYRRLDAILSDYYDRYNAVVEQRQSGEVPRTGVPTGLRDLDELTGGWQPEELNIIAGRPGMGKTSALLGFALHAAKHGTPVGVFSLEMSEHQLAERLVAAKSGVDSNRLRRGWIGDAESEMVVLAIGKLSEAQVFIDETPALALAALEAKATRMVAQDGVGLIVVDYLQLMKGPSPARGRQQNRENEVSAISAGLLALARRLRVPLLVASQLNRAVEQRPGKKPQLSDLRESGSIEQDAHVVLFLHREEVYDSQSPRKGIADLIVAKNRSGPTGEEEVFFDPHTTTFRDLDRTHHSHEGSDR